MKLSDTFIRHVTANGKVRNHSDGGGLFLCVTPAGKKIVAAGVPHYRIFI